MPGRRVSSGLKGVKHMLPGDLGRGGRAVSPSLMQGLPVAELNARRATPLVLRFVCRMKNLLSLLVVVHLSFVAGSAQDGAVTVRADANACELNSLHLDALRNEAAQNPAARMIVKSYGGKTEKTFANDARIRYVRTFLERNKSFDLSRIEFINSGPLGTDGNPKIEFYILQAGEADGKLFLVTYSRPNKTPCLDCCAAEFMPKTIGSKPAVKKRPKKKLKRRRPGSRS